MNIIENKKYKVEFVETRTYVVDVLAKDEAEATLEATDEFNAIINRDMQHYYKVGDTETEVGNIYDVTNTDDPFDPENDEELPNEMNTRPIVE
jgi:hypothetical protein